MTDERSDTRQRLLDGAVALIRERGLDGFSVRALSARVGVSSGAPYRHFADNEALLAGVAAEVESRFLDLVDRHQAACGNDPLDRAKAYGIALVEFAKEHPDHFRLMQSRTLPAAGPNAERSRKARSELVALVESARSGGLLRDADPALMLLTMHAVANGMAHLAADGTLGALGVAPEQVNVTTMAVMRLVDIGLTPPTPETP